MDLSTIGSICSILSLVIALILVERVITINKVVNQIKNKSVEKETFGDDNSQNVDMENIQAEDIVFGNKSKNE